jgi:ABC-type uncharacterized transport system involved in gliding motility auxiliary subunit
MEPSTGRGLSRILVSTTGLAVAFVILILVNVIFSYASFRWDTTEEKTYTLSKESKQVLSTLKEPVTIKFFWSRSAKTFPRNLKLYATRVRDFLAEYEYASKGRVKVEVYDPQPDSEEEEWAQKYGVRPVQTTTGERVYCGLVFTAGDREERIPFLDMGREDLLEYDTTRIIHDLQVSEKKVLGVISGLPIFGSPQGFPVQPNPAPPWLFISELKKTYEVREISPSAREIDPKVDLLLVVFPKSLSPFLQYAVDQYVLGGRSALIFVDPFCLSDPDPGQFMLPPAASLPQLFKVWGFSMDPTEVVADFGQPTRIRTPANVIEENPALISAHGESFDRKTLATSKLNSMLFAMSGAIRREADSPYEFEPLVQSSGNAAMIPIIKLTMGVEGMRRDFSPSGERFTVAALVRGTFKTAFPEGPPKEKPRQAMGKDKAPAEAPPKNHLGEGTGPSTIIVVADADMLADRSYVRRSGGPGLAIAEMMNDNFNFVANACEMLTGGSELIGIRSRTKFQRPFTRVAALQRSAQDRWLAKEQELVKQIEETNRKLRELQMQKDRSQATMLSPEQEAEIQKFQEERRRINRELKEVRKNLREDIELLGLKLKAINILLMPMCVAIAGLLFSFYRQRRMKKS